MGRLVIDPSRITDLQALIRLCPFNAMEEKDGKLEINAACRTCKLCVKKGPAGAITYVEDEKPEIDRSQWTGIAVYADHVDGKLHPVTIELIGKARELAAKIHHPVYALYIGSDSKKIAEELQHYGVDRIFVYEDPKLARFMIQPYTAVFEDFIRKIRPSSILVGATTVGRQLAPRVAARMKTGLTADCTILDMCENTDLEQIRPAFGGNIMAHIRTPNNRPQMATVRYKVMNAPARNAEASGEIVPMQIDPENLTASMEVLDIIPRKKEALIENADILVVAGRGVRKQEDLAMIRELADLLGGMTAGTRPMIESGWMDARQQVGLSGRTVRPKLIITCGVSGSVQFVAGMNHSDTIVAINSDPNAAIFKTAHYCLVGDLYEIIPGLIARIRAEQEV